MTNEMPRLLSLNEVVEITSLSRTFIGKLRADNKFPRQVILGERRIAFVRSEVEAWIEQRIAARE